MVQSRPDDARIRRPLDLLEAIAAGLLALVVVGSAHFLPVGAGELSRNTLRVVRHLPRILVFAAGVIAALATVALLAALIYRLVRYRHLDALNCAASAACGALISIGLIAAWHTFPGGTSAAMLHGTDGTAFVRDTTIVAALTGADVVRYSRWSRKSVLTVGALVITGLGLGELTLYGACVATLAGLAIGWMARWSLHTTVRRPSVESLLAGLQQAGFDVVELERPTPESRELAGKLADGRPIVVKAAGRDVHGSLVAARLWSMVRFRDAATGRQPISVHAQLETEALASLMAVNARVLVPRVLALVHIEPETLVLARECLGGESLSPRTGEEEAVGLFRALRRLHDIGVAHRELTVANLVCEQGRAGFRSLEKAAVGAGELVRRVDIAQLLTSMATALGPEAAVNALRKGYQPPDERAIAAILQPLALRSWGFNEMRHARACIGEVRTRLVGDDTAPLPDARLERFRWRTVFIVVALVGAGFILAGQLSAVNLLAALERADWAWFLVAVLGSAATYVGSAMNLVAFVPQRVSVIRGSLVEVSGAFFGLITPPTVGHVAINGRFLHKEGVDAATTASAVALSQLVNFVITVILLVAMALLTGTGIGHLKIVPSSQLLAVLGGLVVLGIILVTVLPWTKRLFFEHVWPRLKATGPQLLNVVSQPVRLAQGVVGNLLLTTSYVVALIAALHAVGAHPAIIATAAIFMAGNAVGAAAPTPGGLGAVEAVLIAGLSGIGVPYHDAVPGVLLFRIATFWLPIGPGWLIFLVLQKKNIL